MPGSSPTPPPSANKQLSKKGKPEPETEPEAESEARRTFTAPDSTNKFLAQIPKEKLDAVIYLMTTMVYCDKGVIRKYYKNKSRVVSASYPAHLHRYTNVITNERLYRRRAKTLYTYVLLFLVWNGTYRCNACSRDYGQVLRQYYVCQMNLKMNSPKH